MKKLIFVSNNVPLPEERNGNTVNIINIIRELKKRNYYIDFYLFSDDIKRDAPYYDSFSKQVDKLICHRHVSKYLFILNYFRKKIRTESPIFFCNFNTGFYFPIFRSSKSILYAADSVAYQYSKQSGIIARLWYIKMKLEESFLYKKFNKVIFVSPFDLSFTKLDENQGVYVPIGYKDSFHPATDYKNKEYDLVFSGSFDYQPNSDAFSYFIRDIFPILIDRKPDLKICFVGRKPSREMEECARQFSNNIIVTGEVDSVEPYLRKSRVYISPLRKGSGMKNKMLQAMISRLPIVCTSESITGIRDFNKSAIIVTDEARLFAQASLNLLSETDVALEQLGKVNYDCFYNSYTWDAVVSNYYVSLFEV